MPLSWHLLSANLILLCLYTSQALCPEYCDCKQSEQGQRKVSCIRGGLTDPIPTSEMDAGMEVLEITAPSSNPNFLTVSSIFQQFKHLQEVTIRQSNVQQIGMHAFWGVPSIRSLDLSFNNVSSVFDHNFRGLVNLVELRLDDNRIDKLQIGAFRHLTELRILSMQRNLLEELVPRIFIKLNKLHVLKLSGNKFEDLDPEVFKDIPNLHVLELRGCGLQRINTQLYHLLPYLSHLDLGNNQIQFLAEDEFQDLHRLHSLKLDGNMLPVILEKTFVHQQQLKYLCLSKNRLAKITDTAFLNLTSLIELDIGYNKLSKLESFALSHIADNLQRLVISGNNFTLGLIRMILQTLYRVLHLEMAHMKLVALPEKFIPDRIKKVNVSWNNISSLSVQMIPRQLLELDISHNQLQGLNDSVIIKFETFRYLNVLGNPWSCSLCHITPMLFRVNRTLFLKNLTCASPNNLMGKMLLDLKLEEVKPCGFNQSASQSMSKDTLGLLIGLICIVILSIFSVIFVVVSCMRRHSRNVSQQQKRAVVRAENNLENATAIFCKGEISFKFPLDLTERRMSVSTIDDIKKDSQNLPNGNSSGI